MRYKLTFLGMDVQTEEKEVSTIDDIEAFAKEKGYTQFSRTDIEASLKAGWNYEMWFPNYYAKIKIETMA